MFDENENKVHDLSAEIDEDRKKGKGYTTILANIVGDVRKHDIEKAEKLQTDKKNDSNILRKILKKFGWTDREATTMAEDVSGLKKNDVYEEDIVNLEDLKDDEMKLTVKKKIRGLNKSNVLRLNSKDYLILDIVQQEGKEEVTYHLKAC
jgi:hypothetical protein